eukprot:3322587-Alexandrium_andersonii.AAC.1
MGGLPHVLRCAEATQKVSEAPLAEGRELQARNPCKHWEMQKGPMGTRASFHLSTLRCACGSH